MSKTAPLSLFLELNEACNARSTRAAANDASGKCVVCLETKEAWELGRQTIWNVALVRMKVGEDGKFRDCLVCRGCCEEAEKQGRVEEGSFEILLKGWEFSPSSPVYKR